MFAEAAGSRKTIGDVDVVYHDGLYHLFHLVLPNHDYIAHAISTNGVDWRRVDNALFIGHPGSWDDLMLWTMHVSEDPHGPGRWRMFYTGLSRRDQGRYQRVGLAFSDDLYRWTKAPVWWVDHRGADDPAPIKRARAAGLSRGADASRAAHDPASVWPLEPDEQLYEASLEEGRRWVSFRDPFFFDDQGQGRLLVSARVKDGPLIRRGCVAHLEEARPGAFEARPSLYHPGRYDDVEVPNLARFGAWYFLIGSIREDAKVRYWRSDRLHGGWRTGHDNVLLAQGNYAARVSRDDRGWLLWSFFSLSGSERTELNLLPPPKRLTCDPDGRLRLTTFEGLEDRVLEPVRVSRIRALNPRADGDVCRYDGRGAELRCPSGYQCYVLAEDLGCFRLRARLRLEDEGKCGFFLRMDEASQDGYYLALDLAKGAALLRASVTGSPGSGDKMMGFHELQGASWPLERSGEADLQILALGSYLEVSIDGRIVLSLADPTFTDGSLGVYVESAHLELSALSLHRMRSPAQSISHLVNG